jgi:hypothetical protein
VAAAKGGAPAGDGPEGPADRPISDETLMGRLAAGEQEALEPLYQRHARVIYSLAAQTLGPAGAPRAARRSAPDRPPRSIGALSVFAPPRGPGRTRHGAAGRSVSPRPGWGLAVGLHGEQG